MQINKRLQIRLDQTECIIDSLYDSAPMVANVLNEMLDNVIMTAQNEEFDENTDLREEQCDAACKIVKLVASRYYALEI